MPLVRWDGSRVMVQVAVMQGLSSRGCHAGAVMQVVRVTGLLEGGLLKSELKPGFHFLESLPAWFALEAIGD